MEERSGYSSGGAVVPAAVDAFWWGDSGNGAAASVLGSPEVASSRFRFPSSFLSYRFGLF